MAPMAAGAMLVTNWLQGLLGPGTPPAAFGDAGRCQRSYGLDLFQEAPADRADGWLQAHNHYRACHGSPPLQWSDDLVRPAKAWVETLLSRCDGVEDVQEWVRAGSEDEHRPHDPSCYKSDPPMGENIWAGQGLSGSAPEADVVEHWYREVESQCPAHGFAPGCGGMLNHFTALVWKDATKLGCYSAVRRTEFGLFKVADCRYASTQPMGPNGCNVPNTVGCDGAGNEDGLQVPALVQGACPRADSLPAAAPAPQAPAPVAEPAPAAGILVDTASLSCRQKGSLGKCEQCLTSDQCGDGRFCCPFMKKCVKDSTEQCYQPIAFCMPPCPEGQDPATCQCHNADFPCKWAKPNCGEPPPPGCPGLRRLLLL